MVTTIGSLANVPNPGAPITSAWSQDVTRLGVHVFANKGALDAAAWPGLADGMHAYTTDTATRWVRRGGVWRPAPAEAYQATLALLGGSIAGAAVWLGSISVPSIPYAHRVYFDACHLFTWTAAGGTLDLQVRYNTTGGAISGADPLRRSSRFTTAGGQTSAVARGSIDRTAGATTVGVFALTSGPAATAVAGDATLGELIVSVVPV